MKNSSEKYYKHSLQAQIIPVKGVLKVVLTPSHIHSTLLVLPNWLLGNGKCPSDQDQLDVKRVLLKGHPNKFPATI